MDKKLLCFNRRFSQSRDHPALYPSSEGNVSMAKAITTLRQVLNYQPHRAAWFASTQDLFNRVAAFYFEVITAHEGVLDLSSKEALTALETLTHATKENPAPVVPLAEIAEHIPALFRRAAIHAALGSARSFCSLLKKWRAQKEKAQAKGKKFTQRPPVPPRTWNKSTTLYAGQWKDRTQTSILLKLWTGTCWSWIKVRLTGQQLLADVEMGSPSLLRRGNHRLAFGDLVAARPTIPSGTLTVGKQTIADVPSNSGNCWMSNPMSSSWR